MKNLKGQFIKNGGLTVLSIFFLVLGGFAVVYFSLEFLPSKGLKIAGLSIGLGIAAIGGFSGRASALGLSPPFTIDPLGWRSAKKSYQDARPSEEGDERG